MGPRWRKKKIEVKGQIFNCVPFPRLINFVRQRRKTAKSVGSGTQTIPPIKQKEKSLGPVGSVFKKKNLNIFLKPMHSNEEAR